MDVSPQSPGRPDDPESPDATPFDLTPRTGPEPGRRRPSEGGRRRWLAIGGLVAVLAVLGFVLVRGLGDAATFFYNVDEAMEAKDELGGDRFRMQGNVAYGSVTETDRGVDFALRYNGVEVPVSHLGTPPELFGPDIPVVLEGSFEGDTFVSDEILIKHDSTYDEQNPDRVAEAEADVEQGADRGGDGG